jgi:UDP-N-acetylglucosamine 2-epimerase
MLALEPVFVSVDPSWIVVIGDVNSSLAAAIVGAKLRMRIAHVEAGLRSWDRQQPEEINRVLVDQLSSLNFCPSPTAARNLAAEGVVNGVHIVGDVMYDLILSVVGRTTALASAADRLNLTRHQYVVATVHRPSNTDQPDQLAAILECLAAADLPVVFPLHPRTRAALEHSSLHVPGNVHVVEPQTYLGMVALLRDARAVITDSGGVQREAFWLQVPCLTLREETEWVETVEHGGNHLVGADPDRVRGALAAPRPSTAPPPAYGDGNAADRIVSILTGTIEPPATIFGM